MNMHENRTGTGGFTLVEMLIATAVFGVIVAAALGFMTVQNRAFHVGSERLLMVQNLRYASQSLEMDLRTLGSNVPDGQPGLILADEDVVAFSADHTSNVRDFSAVYFDRDAADGMVQAPRTSVNLPNSSYTWPDTVYTALGGAPSAAELIIFFFQPDTSTTRTDDFVLMRQVNGSTPEVLARDLLNQGSTPFLRYFRKRIYTGQSSLDSVPDSALPLFHSAKIHGSAGDTASSAKPDSVRAVRVSFRATNGRTGDDERFIDLSRVIDLPNAGIGIMGACGDQPILDGNLQVAVLGGGGPIQEAIVEYEGLIALKDQLGWMSDPYAVVLGDVVNLLEAALVELNESPPDTVEAAGKIDAAEDKLLQAYADGLVNLGQHMAHMGLLEAIVIGAGEEEFDDDAPFRVHLQWAPSVDESSGEMDVVRYLIYRRSVGGDWGNPIVSIPAGSESYVFDDVTVEPDSTYQYTHAAQDCTPTLSPLSTLQQVIVQ